MLRLSHILRSLPGKSSSLKNSSMPSRRSALCRWSLKRTCHMPLRDPVSSCPAPPLSAQCRGKSLSYVHLWTRFLSALAGLLYASAIVAHDRQPEYLLQATPWFLISLGRAALDLAVSSQAQCPEGWVACLPRTGLHALLWSCWATWRPSSPVIRSLGHADSTSVIHSSGLAQFNDNSLA